MSSFPINFYCVSFILWTLRLLLLLLPRGSHADQGIEIPEIGILRWLPRSSVSDEDHIQWEYGPLASEDVKIIQTERHVKYVVSEHLLVLSIACNASYPVTWKYSGSDHRRSETEFRDYVAVTTLRETGLSIFDAGSFTFSAILHISLENMMGGFRCQSTEDPKVNKSIYVYSQLGNPPYLMFGDLTLTVHSEDNKTMILPCRTSLPDIPVTLYKLIADSFMEIPSTLPHITWDSEVGFILDMPLMDDPFGSYKCVIPEEEETEEGRVFINAVPGLVAKKQVVNFLQGNASYYYDAPSREIKCCAAGPNPPDLHQISCGDPRTCEMDESFVPENGNNGKKSKNSSCTTIYPYSHSGIIRCNGDGIDIVRQYFSNYSKWDKREERRYFFGPDDTEPSQQLKIKQLRKPSSGKIYAKQIVSMVCIAIDYYYSHGVQWALNWRNATVQFLDESYIAAHEEHRFDMEPDDPMREIKIVADTEMVSLTCFAPLWNSRKWKKAIYPLQIRQSSLPSIQGPATEEITFILNAANQTIACKASGEPEPVVRWIRTNRVALNDTNMAILHGEASSSITFRRVSHAVQGEYKCLAGNVAGKATKIIRVVVEVSAPTWNPVSVSITLTIIVILAAGLGFLVWKLELQKKIIDHLAGVAFRDMSRPRGQVNSSQRNEGRDTRSVHRPGVDLDYF